MAKSHHELMRGWEKLKGHSLPWWAWPPWSSLAPPSEHPSLHQCPHIRSTLPRCLQAETGETWGKTVARANIQSNHATITIIQVKGSGFLKSKMSPARILTACGVSRLLMLSISTLLSSSVRSRPSRMAGSLNAGWYSPFKQTQN